MTDESALLAAVIADPADDAPRLVYADWLDDHGEEARAEFIRTQIALARLGPPRRRFEVNRGSWAFHKGEALTAIIQNPDEKPIEVGERIDIQFFEKPKPKWVRREFHGLLVTTAQRLDTRGHVVETGVELKMDEGSTPWDGTGLAEREYELWREFGQSFSMGLPGEAHSIHIGCKVSAGIGSPIYYIFRRGFLAHVTLTTSDFLAHAARLFEQPVETVRLSDRQPYRSNPDNHWWSWFPFRDYFSGLANAARHDLEHCVPNELFDSMQGITVFNDGRRLVSDHHICRFVSDVDAYAALSTAAVRFGRHAARQRSVAV